MKSRFLRRAGALLLALALACSLPFRRQRLPPPP